MTKNFKKNILFNINRKIIGNYILIVLVILFIILIDAFFISNVK